MKKPLLLDLFCKGGGCSYGYYQAGFEVVGVDIEPQPRYPFTFFLDDAFVVLDTLTRGNAWQGHTLDDFAVIHASPPCQFFTSMPMSDEARAKHTNMIDVVRDYLLLAEKPYVIENVENARRFLRDPILLCGEMFHTCGPTWRTDTKSCAGLRVHRHRLFETKPFIFGHHHVTHRHPTAKASRIPRGNEFWSLEGCFGQKADAQAAMGIHWMKTTGSRDIEIAEAIPPIYTQFVGEQMQVYLEQARSIA